MTTLEETLERCRSAESLSRNELLNLNNELLFNLKNTLNQVTQREELLKNLRSETKRLQELCNELILKLVLSENKVYETLKADNVKEYAMRGGHHTIRELVTLAFERQGNTEDVVQRTLQAWERGLSMMQLDNTIRRPQSPGYIKALRNERSAKAPLAPINGIVR